ncbi:TIGR02302 family protein [Roseomonas elaeocarpi]|uniref:TIGR02302 family protein n=1 Tax=Roseomonas elaeocarpi TaxID=907779 RepID=A0ABV6JMD5_9PROT
MAKAPEQWSRRLARQRRVARAALVWETLWPRLWPVLAVIGVFLLLALGGLFLLLPATLHWLLLIGFAAALGFAAWRAARGFALPGAPAADRRIERDSGLRHRPLLALADAPATEDPAALALWQVHQRREAERLGRLRVRAPSPGLPARDRRALRLGLTVALAAAAVVAGGEGGERLRRAVTPPLGTPRVVPAQRVEAWVTPPGYTGAAPIFLAMAGGAAAGTSAGSGQAGAPANNITVPAGSALRVALSGGEGGTPELLLDSAAQGFAAIDGGSFTAEATLTQGGRLSVRRDGQEVAAWSITVQNDAAPTIAFTEPPGPAGNRGPAGGLALRLPWQATDDWGIASARAEFRLDARPAAEALVVPLPLPGGNGRAVKAVAQPDLTAHPWAGLPVQVQLVARDGAEQEGRSATVSLILPERHFNHPVAQLLVQFRKMLAMMPENRDPVIGGLDGVMSNPDSFNNDTAIFLSLSAARGQLRHDNRAEAIAEVQSLLWQLALVLEEGRTDRTARALAEARQALERALNDRDPNRSEAERRAELERRVEALREAIQRHLQALAEKLQQQNGEQSPQQADRTPDERRLDEGTDRMRDAAREGREEDAKRELAEMEDMLKALEEGRVTTAGNEQRRQQRQQGQSQRSAVQDMVQRQSQLLDQSHQRADGAEERNALQRQLDRLPFGGIPRDGFRQRPGSEGERQRGAENGAPQAGAPQQPPGSDVQRDARTQRALRRALGELAQQFGELTGEVPEALSRADQAMREGAEALAQGRDAQDAQARAVQALAQGGQQMAQAMRQRFGPPQPGDGEGEGEGEGQGLAQGQPGGENGEGDNRGGDQATAQGQGRDPLGRPVRPGTGTAQDGGDTRVPDEAEVLRTRRLQDELRRRVGERERPQEELDYYDRLLRRF